MGVPKFFRWVSERYPTLSSKVKSDEVPEFDNLYLDMNGIIHPCSHPSDDPTFVITEEQIFDNIFRYLEFLIQTIKVNIFGDLFLRVFQKCVSFLKSGDERETPP